MISIMIVSGCSKSEKIEDKSSAMNVLSGEIIQIVDVDSYTYMELKSDDGNIWIAAANILVEKGNVVYYSNPLLMKDFYSKTLDRSFSQIYFVNKVYFNKELRAKSVNKQTMGGHSTMTSAVIIDKNYTIEKAEGGYNIAELYKNAESLKNNKILLKAKVIKYLTNIMGKNWVHLQDGSEFNGKFDMTITSSEKFDQGEIVVIEGVLKIEQDFGYGYYYPVLIENAVRK